MSDPLEIVDSTSGLLEAEILRGLLEAAGLTVCLSHESAGTVYGLGVGPLGRVDILVPAAQSSEARRILEDYRAGRLADRSSE
jgi:hypothetical protein